MPKKDIRKAIRELVSDECSRSIVGMCETTERECHVIDDASEIIRLDCPFFEEHVLPADWSFEDLIAYAVWYDTSKT